LLGIRFGSDSFEFLTVLIHDFLTAYSLRPFMLRIGSLALLFGSNCLSLFNVAFCFIFILAMSFKVYRFNLVIVA
jgi:hypothetical protein